MPSLLPWQTGWANRRLNRFSQPHLAVRELQARLKTRMRVAEDGFTLLVDYGPLPGGFAHHHAGHAVYTAPRYLQFHAEQTAEHFDRRQPTDQPGTPP